MWNNNSTNAASLIGLAHARFEALDAAYEATEKAQMDQGSGMTNGRYRELGDALSDNQRERDLLQKTILRTRPQSGRDAAIFAFHLALASEAISVVEPDDTISDTIDLLTDATEILFDGMVTAGFADMAEIGASFQKMAMRAYGRRCDREGMPEEVQ